MKIYIAHVNGYDMRAFWTRKEANDYAASMQSESDLYYAEVDEVFISDNAEASGRRDQAAFAEPDGCDNSGDGK